MKPFKPGELVRCIRKLPDLLKRERDVLVAMGECANSNGDNCYPGEKLLMAMTGYKKRDTITYALSGLRKKALILRDGKHGYTDKYHLNVPGMSNYVPVGELKTNERGDYLTPERIPPIFPKQGQIEQERDIVGARKGQERKYGGVRIIPDARTVEATPAPQKPPKSWRTNQPNLRTDGWTPPKINYQELAQEMRGEQAPLPEEERIKQELASLRRMHNLGVAPDRLLQYAQRHKLPLELVQEVINFRVPS